MCPRTIVAAFKVAFVVASCVILPPSESAALPPPAAAAALRPQQMGIGLEQQQAKHETVPVIQLPSEDRKVSDDDYLALFPKEVLQSDAQFKPINFRVVEHDDFIDYEFDFVEEPNGSESGSSRKVPRRVDTGKASSGNALQQQQTSFTSKPSSSTTTMELTQTAAEVTFADLLQRARHRHRQLNNANVPQQKTTTPMTPQNDDDTTIRPAKVAASSADSNLTPMQRKHFGSPHLRTPHKTLRVQQRLLRTTTTTTQQPPSTSTQVFTDVQTASALVVTRNVTSTRVVTSAVLPEVATTTEVPEPTTEAMETTTDTVTTTISPTTVTTQVSTTVTITPTTDSLEDDTTTTAAQSMDSHRIPRIVDSNWEEAVDGGDASLTQQIYSGQYHEVNPGQYQEEHPGQYHEVNPGQYHEVNPGQYRDEEEHTGGQYDHTEKEGGGKTDENLKVEVERTSGDRRVYNVQSKVDEFIIGEFGTISEKNGQTLQGVRYTALDSDVDPKLIYDTLQKFFKFS